MKKIAGLKSARKDKQTVTKTGDRLMQLPEGVSIKEIKTQVDSRGSLCELFDKRWEWSKKPLVYAFMFTIRPGVVKGWGVHKKNEDRYCILFGEMETVLYDGRQNSKTFGLVSRIMLTELNRMLLSIPPGVWHADRNVGSRDVVVVNFPTTGYDHINPDKYRLPINNDQIPYKFPPQVIEG
jgi:dTDP-4-dehydrorhamnose 3,5-epimerase